MRNLYDIEKIKALIKGKNIAVCANLTGMLNLDGRYQHVIHLIKENNWATLKAVYMPEHGIYNEYHHGVQVEDYFDKELHAPCYYIWNSDKDWNRMTEGVDLILYFIQEAGSLFYTFKQNLCELIKVSNDKQIELLLIDKPNPLNGEILEGNFEDRFLPLSLPIRHGLTDGELALMLIKEKNYDFPLHIVKVNDLKRSMWFEDLDLPWIPPSTALPNLTATLLYTGTGSFQGSNISMGRGTYSPFEVIGAPWIDGKTMANDLNGLNLPGVIFSWTNFKPDFDALSGEKCSGVRIHVMDHNEIRPYSIMIHLISYLMKYYPNKLQLNEHHLLRLRQSGEMLKQKLPATEILESCEPKLKKFDEYRQEFFLY